MKLPPPPTPEEALKLALAVVAEDKFPMMATAEGDQPRLRPVSPVKTAGFRANAIFVVDGKPQRFVLEPVEEIKLVGTSPVAMPAGVKGAVQLTAPDGVTAQAKF